MKTRHDAEVLVCDRICQAIQYLVKGKMWDRDLQNDVDVVWEFEYPIPIGMSHQLNELLQLQVLPADTRSVR